MVLNPLVSVILPVYNSEQFLRESIDSIINQTYTNLEIIIVNDGSTDGSKSIIESYLDKRIIVIEHPNNKGLIQSLNEAIIKSTGSYLVRMDGDDVAFNTRIEKQVHFLQENPSIGIIGTDAIFFKDHIGMPAKNWERALNTKTPAAIKKVLLWENCMIHPSICMRGAIAKQLLYNANQVNYEDYDLWLRAIANNYKIAKLNEPLLYYRIQEDSITQTTLRKSNFYFQKAGVKFRFFKNCLSKGKLNFFIFGVFATLFVDLVLGIAKGLKQSNK
jgi:glycosyltransferase involved in cell wall biosynthesis